MTLSQHLLRSKEFLQLNPDRGQRGQGRQPGHSECHRVALLRRLGPPSRVVVLVLSLQ